MRKKILAIKVNTFCINQSMIQSLKWKLKLVKNTRENSNKTTKLFQEKNEDNFKLKFTKLNLFKLNLHFSREKVLKLHILR